MDIAGDARFAEYPEDPGVSRHLAAGELPPRVEHGVVVGSVPQVGELQTEARSSQSRRPHPRVLTMTSLGASSPLIGEVLGDIRMGPAERVRAVLDEIERVVPAIVIGDS